MNYLTLIMAGVLALWFIARTHVELRQLGKPNWWVYLILVLTKGALLAVQFMAHISYNLTPYLLVQGFPLPVRFAVWHTNRWVYELPSKAYLVCNLCANIAITWAVGLLILRFFIRRKIDQRARLEGIKVRLM